MGVDGSVEGDGVADGEGRAVGARVVLVGVAVRVLFAVGEALGGRWAVDVLRDAWPA
jgi:hypothetical protein